jgi:hypothetical protein
MHGSADPHGMNFNDPCNIDPCNIDPCNADYYTKAKSPRVTDKSTDSYTKFIKKHEKQLRKKHEEQKKKKSSLQSKVKKSNLKSMVQCSFTNDDYYSRNPAD